MASPKKAVGDSKRVAPEMQAFVDQRRRPAVFLFLKDFTQAGGRILAARLVERRIVLPWPPASAAEHSA